MIYPIVRYGNPILRQRAKEIFQDYPHLSTIIQNMWDTMYATSGVGLAAPQVNLPIRLFMIDSVQMFKDDASFEKKYPDSPGLKQVFINPIIKDLAGELWQFEEGCLSLPFVRSNVERKQYVTLEYVDENFQKQVKPFTGITARVILHEYDHLEGKLFIDYLSPLRKKLFASKLADITKGKINPKYKMM